MNARRTRSRVRTLARLTFANPAFANPVSAVYLTLVAAAVGTAATEPLWAQYPDGLVWVWPMFLTVPVFFVVPAADWALWDGEMPTWLVTAGIIVSALVQSLALGALLETLGGRHRRLTPPHGG
ncbi:SCO4225 family membrane protein [Streptomyces sp. NPDC001848]|uniref:SCO4225 family membrane protein n=1 Tax=Streptomyces sp. NPDC001848 TaxID=3364618 RepID=UPI0036BFA741